MASRKDGLRPTRLVRSGRAIVHYAPEALSRREAAAFALLAARGVREIARLVGRPARAAVRFELRSGAHISTARGRTIAISAFRVRARTAPYLHEIAHVLLPCPHAPEWFSEGLACYLESAAAEPAGGYDSRLFTSAGNPGVDDDARRWLAGPRGRRVLPFIGTRGMPNRIVADRENVAAPFYVLAHSLVKFLVEQVGVKAVARVARAREFALQLRRATGSTRAALRQQWLRRLAPPSAPARPRKRLQSASARNSRGG